MKALRWAKMALIPAAAMAAMVALFECSSERPPLAGDGTGTGGGPASGPCPVEGETQACHAVVGQHDGYVDCFNGQQTCTGGTWGPCIGGSDTGGSVTTHALPVGGFATASSAGSGSIHTLSLSDAGNADAGAPCNVDVCNPYCWGFNEVPPAPVGPTTCGVSGGCTAFEVPAGPLATYVADLSAGLQGQPTTCTPGTSEACNYDTQCVGTACTPYAASGKNPACSTRPDFTVNAACYDGTNWELTVCNRGGVDATSGTLKVAINSGSPTGTAGTCPFPTGPVVGSSGSDKGECDINLAAQPLASGRCFTFTPATAGFCAAAGGGAITNWSGTHFFVVNPTTSILTSATPVTECDTCNNYAAVQNTQAGKAEAACTATTACSGTGTADGGASSDGGTSCTTVTGTVYDPGMNVPLPNVVVYQPASLPLPTLTPGLPHCDSCTSLLPPLLSSVVTDVNGNFTLPVFGTTNIPVVIQTGRWRRKFNVASVATCGTASLGNINFPQDSTQGDIPQIAIVTGTHEALECDLAKFMGSTAEFGSSSSTKRIHIYNDNGATISGGTGVATLLASQSQLDKYDIIMAGCMGVSTPFSAMGSSTQGLVQTYLAGGGKLFLDHHAMDALLWPTPTGGATTSLKNAVTTWAGSMWNAPTGLVDAKVGPPSQSDTPHSGFRQWLTNRGAYSGGVLATPQGCNDGPLTPNYTDSFEWLRGANGSGGGNWGSNPNGNYSVTFSFDTNDAGAITPVYADDAGTFSAPGCGRVIATAMHVDSSRGTGSGTFPSECSLGTAVSANEMGFEYLMFALMGCSATSSPTPPPPIPPPPTATPPTPVTYTDTFSFATCPAGTQAKWDTFGYNASVPAGTSIQFSAQVQNPPDASSWVPTTPAGPPVGIPLANAPVDHPASCQVTGPSPCGNNCPSATSGAPACPSSCNCPIDLGAALSGSSAQYPFYSQLQVNVLLTPSAGSCAGTVSPGLLTTASGVLNCSAGAKDLSGSGAACTAANQYTTCGQDFHCDIGGTNTCVWNLAASSGPGWYDTKCVVGGKAGVDLTLEPSCFDGTVYQNPVCNRGAGTIPAGQTINLSEDRGVGVYSSCSGSTTIKCSQVLTSPLGPGQCINIPCTPSTVGSGNSFFTVNPGNTVRDANGNAECNGTSQGATWPANGGGAGCLDNGSGERPNGGSCPMTCNPPLGAPSSPSLSGWTATYSCVPNQ